MASIALVAFPFRGGAQSPQSPTVAAGSVAITQQGATTVVTQGTARAVVDWRSFSIGPQNAVRFDQPGASSVTLNRVTGAEISRIDGNLTANGQVWLANPNGVLIGAGGQVNVGGLLATTGRVDAAEFLRSGRAQIDQIAKDSAIINQGSINIAEGGYAALAAAAIRNEGVIAARTGAVALGAGKAMTLDFAGDKLISFQVTQPLDQAPANAEALISNSGTIAARGGNVLMTARAAKGVIDSVVNLKGHVVSNSVRVDGGTVVFGDGGAVQVSGKIEAVGADGQGGTVAVLGEKVGLMDGASIDASGALIGGTVLVGGDWQGKGAPGANGQNALVTYVAPGASITVEATQTGAGGKAVVWADDTTRFNGQISAKGGKVETSGKKTLNVGAGAKVKAGSWLLDPSDITISPGGTGTLTGGVFDPAGVSTIDPATITTGLVTGDVTIQTSGGAGGSGDITFGGSVSTASGTIRTLKLLADRNILMSGTIAMTGAAHNVVLNSRASGAAEGAIFLNGNSVISTTGGTISLVGGISGAGAAGGSVASVDGIALFDTTLSAGAGAIVMSGTGRLADVTALNLGVRLERATLSASGGITITGVSGDQASGAAYGVYATSSSLTAGGAGSITITGSAIGSSPSAAGFLANTGVVMSLGSGGLNIAGSSTGTGTAGNSHGVDLAGSSISSAGAITISGTAGGGPSHGVQLGGTLTSTGGSISITGTRGAGAGSNNVSIGGGLLQTTGGDITIVGTATSGGATSNNYGVLLFNSAVVTTGTGTISVAGAGAITGSFNDGAAIGNLTSTATISATGATGAIIVNGSRGAGRSANVSVYGATLSAQGGNIILNGSSAGAGGAVVNTGVMIAKNNANNASLTTTNGTIAITGTGGSAGNSDGVAIGDDLGGHYGGVTIAATGAGAVQIVGTRGGTPGRNIYAYGASTQISTGSGNLTLDGSALTAGANQDHGVYLATGPIVTTSTGTISISGSGATTGTSNDGVNINAATVTTTGVGGVIQITGLSGAGGSGISNVNGLVRAGNVLGDLTLTADSIASNNQYQFGANNGTIFVRPDQPNKSIGVDGGAGTFQVLVDRFNGALNIGRPDLTAPITVGAGLVFPKPTTLTTGGSPINFNGAIDGGGGYDLTLNAGAGSVSFGGSVGSTYPFATLTKIGGGTLYVGGTVATTGTQSYAGATVLTGASTFSATNGAITFAGPVNGAFSFSANAPTISLTGGVGSSTPLGSLSVGGVAVLGGTLITTAAQTYQTANIAANTTLNASGGATVGSITGTGALTIIASSGNISLTNGGVGIGALSATAVSGNILTTGNINASGVVALTAAGTLTTQGDIATTANISLTGSSIVIGQPAGANYNGAAVSFNGPVIVTSNTNIGNTVSTLFSSTVDGFASNVQQLYLNGAGLVTLQGSVGVTNFPISFNRSGGGTLFTGGPISLRSNIVSLGNGPIILGSDTTIAFMSPLSLTGPIDASSPGNFGLTLNGSGSAPVNFQSSIGSTSELKFLTVTNTASVGTFANATLITQNTLDLGASPYTIATAANLSSTNGLITSAGAIDGPGSLIASIGAAGSLAFSGTIGGVTPLASFTQLGSGAVSIGGAVSTAGSQSYTGSVVLGGGATFSTTGGNLIFAGPVNGSTVGGQSLSTSVVGTVSLLGGVGGATALASLNFTNTAVLGGTVVTTGSQTYQTANFLTNTTIVTANSPVLFNSMNDGPGGLTLITGSGNVTLGANVGAGTPLAFLSQSGTGQVTVFNNVITTGPQSYAGPVGVFSGAGLFSTANSAITFAGTLDGSSPVIVSAGTGAVSLGGDVGATTALNSFTQTGSGNLYLGGTITTTGAQSYAGSVVVTGAAAQFNAGGVLTMTGPVNGLTSGANSASFIGAATSITGGIGATTPLASLNLSSAAAVLAGAFITTGAQTYGTVTLVGATTLATTGGSLFIAGNVSGAQALIVDTGTGSATVNNTLGFGAPLTSFVSLGTGVFTVGGAVISTGAQSYTGPVVIPGSTAFQTSNMDVTFSSTLNGASAGGQFPNFSIGTGTVSFVGDVGATTALASLTIGAGTTVRVGGAITTSGSQTYGGGVLTAGPAILQSNTSSITFAGAINSTTPGSNSLTLNLLGAGAAPVFGAAIGGTTAPQSLSIATNGAAVNLPSVTAGNLTVTTSNGQISQGGPALISGLTTLSAGTGNILLTNVGNDFSSLSIASAAAVQVTDSGGDLSLGSVTATSAAVLTAVGSVTQTGALVSPILLLQGAGATYTLTAGNSVGTLAANVGALSFTENSSSALTIGTFFGVGGVTTVAGASLTGAQALTLNNGVTGTNVTLASNTTISGVATVTATTLTLSATGSGSSINAVVNGQTGAAAAALINVLAGTISANGTTIMPTVASTPSTPSVASTPTVATVATVASVPSVATVASVAPVPTVASIASVATMATVATTPSLASVASTASQATQSAVVAALAAINQTSGGGTSIITQIIQPAANFSLGSTSASSSSVNAAFGSQSTTAAGTGSGSATTTTTGTGGGSGSTTSSSSSSSSTGSGTASSTTSEENADQSAPSKPAGSQTAQPAQSSGQSNTQPSGGASAVSAAIQQRTNVVNSAPPGALVPPLPVAPGSSIPSPQTVTRTVSSADSSFGSGPSQPVASGPVTPTSGTSALTGGGSLSTGGSSLPTGGSTPAGAGVTSTGGSSAPAAGTSGGTKFDTPGETIAPQSQPSQTLVPGVISREGPRAVTPDVGTPDAGTPGVDTPFPSLGDSARWTAD